MKDLGKKLELLRRTKGFSKSYVGEQLGTTHSTVYQWEKGVSPPDLFTMVQLAEIYGYGDRIGSFFRALGFHNEEQTITVSEWAAEQVKLAHEATEEPSDDEYQSRKGNPGHQGASGAFKMGQPIHISGTIEPSRRQAGNTKAYLAAHHQTMLSDPQFRAMYLDSGEHSERELVGAGSR
jgi:transcriptional regulator with XRE-family HTH domain